MASLRLLDVHRTWEDWFSVILGVLIACTPWIGGHPANEPITWNAIIVGALVVGLALLALVNLQTWEESLELICGLWLIASPFLFGYAGALRTWHVVLGAIVVLLAALALYQDWNRSELAHHGR